MEETSDLHIERLVVGPLAVNCYLVGDPSAGEAFLVDPGDEADRIGESIRQGRWRLTEVVLTHAHFDHVLAAGEVLEEFEASFAVPEDDVPVLERTPRSVEAWMGLVVDPPPPPDRLLKDSDRITAGRYSFTVAASPGHSPGGICLIGEGVVFAGDTLFAGSIGRTDLPGADHGVLMESIRRNLWPLPDETVVLPGHGPTTTMGRERRSNPFLAELRSD